jgi:hydrogenase-4 component F
MILVAVLLAPLFASAMTALLRGRRAMEAIHLVSAAVMFGLSVALAAEVLAAGGVSWGDGFLHADHFSALVALLTGFVYLAAAPYAVGYFRRDSADNAFEHNGAGPPAEKKLFQYYALAPLFAFSMFLVVLANNLGVMWVAIEGTTLASIFLVTFYGRPTSLEAAWKYAMIGSVGLSMALFGTILTYYSAYQVLGMDTLNALNWSALVSSAARFDKNVMQLAFILVLLGFGTKAGLAPMHTWKPDAYGEAPVPAVVLMAAALLNCAIYALARFYVLTVHCLGPSFPSRLLILFGLLSMAVAVPFILVQRSYRRLLAYSSIDHGGIMVLGLGFGGALGALGMLLHMTFHSITKPLLFFCAGNAQQHLGTDSLRKNPGGLLHSLPLSAPMFLLATLAVTGTPPFSLFQSEFTILRAGFAARHTAASILLVVFLVSIFCGFFAHIAQLVLGPANGRPRGEDSRWKSYPVLGLALVVIVIGFWLPAPLFALVEGAARVLEVGP